MTTLVSKFLKFTKYMDMNFNEIRNHILHKISAWPGVAIAGMIIYNTSKQRPEFWDGSAAFGMGKLYADEVKFLATGELPYAEVNSVLLALQAQKVSPADVNDALSYYYTIIQLQTSGQSSINGDNITSGTIAPARLGSGTPTAAKVLLGNNTWATPADLGLIDGTGSANHFPYFSDGNTLAASGLRYENTSFGTEFVNVPTTADTAPLNHRLSDGGFGVRRYMDATGSMYEGWNQQMTWDAGSGSYKVKSATTNAAVNHSRKVWGYEGTFQFQHAAPLAQGTEITAWLTRFQIANNGDVSVGTNLSVGNKLTANNAEINGITINAGTTDPRISTTGGLEFSGNDASVYIRLITAGGRGYIQNNNLSLTGINATQGETLIINFADTSFGGNVAVTGDVYAQTNKKLATEEYVNSLNQGAVRYKGTADASAATIALATGTSSHVTGDRYKIAVSGNVFGSAAFVGDFATYNGATWDVEDATEANIVGTAGKIQVTKTGDDEYTLTIPNDYIGQNSITTLGTITTGVWNGSAIPITHGGTAANTIVGARQNLKTAGAVPIEIIGNGVLTEFPIAHNLSLANKYAFDVKLYDSATDDEWDVEQVPVDTNNSTLKFSGYVPTNGQTFKGMLWGVS